MRRLFLGVCVSAAAIIAMVFAAPGAGAVTPKNATITQTQTITKNGHTTVTKCVKEIRNYVVVSDVCTVITH